MNADAKPDTPASPFDSVARSLARMAESVADLAQAAAAEAVAAGGLPRVPRPPDFPAGPTQSPDAGVSESSSSTNFGFIDPRDYGIGDDPRFVVGGPGGLNPGAAYLDRRRRGEYIPAFLNEQQLRWLRWQIRTLCVNNEIALAVLSNRANYAVGPGFTYKVTPKTPATPPGVVARAQAVIDAFAAINWLPQREVECLTRTDIDGEAFVRLFPSDEDCILRLRFVEPDHVKSPTGSGDDAETSFGVHTAKLDVEDVKGYWVVQGLPDERPTPTFVPAAEIVHFKSLETPATSKRGLSPFFPIQTNLRLAEDLLTSTVALAKARAKIAMIRRLAGAVSSVAQALVRSQSAVTATDPQTGNVTDIEKMGYGTIITTSDQVEHEFPNANIAASDHVAVYQMCLRTIGARFDMPEYMISGDASNNNYASALVSEAPFVRGMTTLQRRLAWLWAESRYGAAGMAVVWRQLHHAARRGVLPRDIAALVDVQCEGPALVSRDPVKQAQSDSIDVRSRIKSRTTCQLERGLDPETERRHFGEEGPQPDEQPDPTDDAVQRGEPGRDG